MGVSWCFQNLGALFQRSPCNKDPPEMGVYSSSWDGKSEVPFEGLAGSFWVNMRQVERC